MLDLRLPQRVGPLIQQTIAWFRSRRGRVLAILAMFILTSPAHADTYVDACKEADGPPNGVGIPYSKVSDGVAAAPQDGTVVIKGSVVTKGPDGAITQTVTRPYPESGRLPLVLNKRMTLRAEDGAATIGVPAGTRKVWQLTGERDLERNVPTETFRVHPDNRVSGTDLGASFEHDGRIYFLFGDTWPPQPNAADKRPPYRPKDSDSIAWIDAGTDPEQPIALNFITAPDGGYLSPRVLCPGICPDPDGGGPDPEGVLPRAEYEVPLSGFSAKGKMYVFFSTDTREVTVKEENCRKLTYMGKSVLARLNTMTENTFDYVYDVSCLPNPNPEDLPCRRLAEGKFINIAAVVVNNADWPELPQPTGSGKGVLLWGTGKYRRSDPYLAYLPLDQIEDPSALRYALVDTKSNLVSWSQWEGDATPLFTQDCFGPPPSCTPTTEPTPTIAPCDKMGELSVAWNPFLRKWIMLYNHGSPEGINYRTAEKPWGPWSPPAVLFNRFCDHGLCHFMHRPQEGYNCDSVHDQPWWETADPAKNVWAGAYGPYIVSAFTKGDADTTTIYWLMSTWNPYQVMLMKSTLRLSDGLRVDQQPRLR